jgi:hypothetical protein
MHQVHLDLNDQLYDLAKRRADEAGFKTVSEFLTDVVSEELTEDSEDLDHLFTPQRIALIDKAAAQIKVGQFLTAKQVDVELAKRRTEWLQNNPV